VASPRALLAALTLGWTIVWVQRAALSPAGPLLQAELGLDYGQLGALSTAGVVGGAAGYLVAGWLAHHRLRGTMLAGAALLAVATLASWRAGTYLALLASQGVAGFAEGLFYVPALAAITRATEPGKSGRALGTLDMGISLGTFVALLLAPSLFAAAGSRGGFLAGGVLGLLVVPVLMAAVGRAAPVAPPAWREVLRRRAWPLYVAIAMLLVVYFTLVYLSPAFLVSRGFRAADADLVAAAAVVLGVPLHVVGGVLGDRVGPLRSATAFLVASGAAVALLALASSPALSAAALVAAYVLGIGGFVGVILLVPRVLGAHLAAPAFGVFWGIGYLGGALGPSLVGAAADAVGFAPALLGLAALTFLAAAALQPLARA